MLPITFDVCFLKRSSQRVQNRRRVCRGWFRHSREIGFDHLRYRHAALLCIALRAAYHAFIHAQGQLRHIRMISKKSYVRPCPFLSAFIRVHPWPILFLLEISRSRPRAYTLEVAMTRRDLLAAALSAPLLRSAPAKLKIGITDWNLRLAANPDAIPLAAKLGFDGVQISCGRRLVDDKMPLDNPDAIARCLALSKEHNIPIDGTCVDRLHENGLKSDKLAFLWVRDSIPLTKPLAPQLPLPPSSLQRPTH